jgi:serine/threonine-protein kinase PknK
MDAGDFIDTLDRVAGGGSLVDPALVQELIRARRRNDPLARTSDDHRRVLAVVTYLELR